jgi:hypothetical protein
LRGREPAAAFVGGNAVQDGGGVALDDAGDLGAAVAAKRVVTDEPPQLVSGGCDSLGPARAAELLRGNAATDADVVEQLA